MGSWRYDRARSALQILPRQASHPRTSYDPAARGKNRSPASGRRDPWPVEDELEYVRSLHQTASDLAFVQRDRTHRLVTPEIRSRVLRLSLVHLRSNARGTCADSYTA